MFTKKEFDLAKKLYYPLKVIELCKEHQMEVDFKDKDGTIFIYLRKGGLTAAVVAYRHIDQDVVHCVKRMISYFEWKLTQHIGKGVREFEPSN